MRVIENVRQRCHRDVLSWLKEWDKCVYKAIAPGMQAKKRNRVEWNEEFAYVSCLLEDSTISLS